MRYRLVNKKTRDEFLAPFQWDLSRLWLFTLASASSPGKGSISKLRHRSRPPALALKEYQGTSINWRFLMTQGYVAAFKGYKPLKTKKSKNHTFSFSCPENSGMELSSAFLEQLSNFLGSTFYIQENQPQFSFRLGHDSNNSFVTGIGHQDITGIPFNQHLFEFAPS